MWVHWRLTVSFGHPTEQWSVEYNVCSMQILALESVRRAFHCGITPLEPIAACWQTAVKIRPQTSVSFSRASFVIVGA